MSYQRKIIEIRRLTCIDGKSKTQRIAKLCEEVGELAAAILSETNAPGCEYKTLDAQDVLEEVCDVLIVAMSIAEHYRFPDELIQNTLDQKLEKWKRVIGEEHE